MAQEKQGARPTLPRMDGGEIRRRSRRRRRRRGRGVKASRKRQHLNQHFLRRCFYARLLFRATYAQNTREIIIPRQTILTLLYFKITMLSFSGPASVRDSWFKTGPGLCLSLWLACSTCRQAEINRLLCVQIRLLWPAAGRGGHRPDPRLPRALRGSARLPTASHGSRSGLLSHLHTSLLLETC